MTHATGLSEVPANCRKLNINTKRMILLSWGCRICIGITQPKQYEYSCHPPNKTPISIVQCNTALQLPIQLHHLTTFSTLQFAHRGCWQLGQASVLMGTGVCPQEHFSQGLESALPVQMRRVRGASYAGPEKDGSLLALLVLR
jgi:hypothetical protein